MSGAIINAAGIVAGGGAALIFKKPIPNRYQLVLKIALGVYTVWFGLKLSWTAFNGSFRQVFKELAIVVLAMIAGRLTGRLLRLQRLSNSVGQYASRLLASPPHPKRFADGFVVATALFCAGPLALFASVQEGFAGFSPLFIVKAGADGLAAYSFYTIFGWGVIVSALPVFALEGALIRVTAAIAPLLPIRSWPLSDSILAVDGLLIFCVAMLILELKKIEVADYFPSLIFAPLLAWWVW